MARPEKCCVAHLKPGIVNAKEEFVGFAQLPARLGYSFSCYQSEALSRGVSWRLCQCVHLLIQWTPIEHLLCSRHSTRGCGHGPCPRGDYFPFRGREVNR